MEWLTVKLDGSGLKPRWGHSACFVKQEEIWVFGGGAVAGGPGSGGCSAEMWKLSFTDLTYTDCVWSKPPLNGEQPCARTCHTCVVRGDQLIIFGGWNAGECLSDVWTLHTERRLWKEMKCTGEIPCARYSHSACIYNDVMYVFAGKGHDGLLNDLYTLNLDTWEWTRVKALGMVPEARELHGVAIVDNLMFIVGGWGGMHFFGDARPLDCETNSWLSPSIMGNAPSPRWGSSCTTLGKRFIFCFGGKAQGETLFADSFVLDAQGLAWLPLAMRGSGPGSRWGAAICSDPTRNFIVLIGGDNGHTRLGDIAIGRLVGEDDVMKTKEGPKVLGELRRLAEENESNRRVAEHSLASTKTELMSVGKDKHRLQDQLSRSESNYEGALQAKREAERAKSLAEAAKFTAEEALADLRQQYEMDIRAVEVKWQRKVEEAEYLKDEAEREATKAERAKEKLFEKLERAEQSHVRTIEDWRHRLKDSEALNTGLNARITTLEGVVAECKAAQAALRSAESDLAQCKDDLASIENRHLAALESERLRTREESKKTDIAEKKVAQLESSLDREQARIAGLEREISLEKQRRLDAEAAIRTAQKTMDDLSERWHRRVESEKREVESIDAVRRQFYGAIPFESGRY
jgi:hypothetical protein